MFHNSVSSICVLPVFRCDSTLCAHSRAEVHLDNISHYFAVDVRFDGKMKAEKKSSETE